jgi:hypothetical protein
MRTKEDQEKFKHSITTMMSDQMVDDINKLALKQFENNTSQAIRHIINKYFSRHK